MHCHQYFFGSKYDLIQLHKQIIHQNDGIFKKKLIEIFTTSIFYSRFKENNKNEMIFCYFSWLGCTVFGPVLRTVLWQVSAHPRLLTGWSIRVEMRLQIYFGSNMILRIPEFSFNFLTSSVWLLEFA